MVVTHPSQNRRLRIIVAAATLGSLGLRLWPPGRLGLNQFDEGIYALAAGWTTTPGGLAALSPTLIAYAPPGFPILAGLMSFIVNSADQASILVSTLLGAATVSVVAWLAREIFGPRAAVVAAWTTCCSGPHIAFSRMALTDASFLFAWSVGFVAGLRFLRQPRWSTGLIMGGMVGICQEFKYNGWLLGAVIMLTACTSRTIDSKSTTWGTWLRLAGWGGLGVVVAWSVVYPWFRFVEQHGGYAALLAHQRSYLGGWSAWWPNLLVQSRQAVALSGPAWLGIASAVLGAASCAWIERADPLDRIPRATLFRAVLTGVVVWPLQTAPVTTGLLGVAAIWTSRSMGTRFLIVGWVGLFMLAPFYHPYARLWLPFEMIQWLLLAGLANRCWDGESAGFELTGKVWRRWWLPAAAGVTCAGTLLVGPGFPLAGTGHLAHGELFDPSDSLRYAAAELAGAIPPEVTAVRTLIRPALSFYLGGRILILPQGEVHQFLQSTDVRQWGLIDSAVIAPGPSQESRSILEPLWREWEVVTEVRARTTLPTALDLDPADRRESGPRPLASLWLIRPRRSNASP